MNGSGLKMLLITFLFHLKHEFVAIVSLLAESAMQQRPPAQVNIYTNNDILISNAEGITAFHTDGLVVE